MNEIVLKNIYVKAGDKLVVKNASLRALAGEAHVLMGANGSGKSSLVNALFGYPSLDIHSGTFSHNGKFITRLPTHKKAVRGLFLSQQHTPEIDGVSLIFLLYSVSKATQNYSGTMGEYFNYASSTAEQFGLNKEHLKRSLKSGLSGGEKKHIELLQLLLLKPQFAFLDEIDSGLDINMIKKTTSVVNALQKTGTGFILVTHNPKLLSLIKLTKIHLMSGGKIIKTGDSKLLRKLSEKGF